MTPCKKNKSKFFPGKDNNSELNIFLKLWNINKTKQKKTEQNNLKHKDKS